MTKTSLILVLLFSFSTLLFAQAPETMLIYGKAVDGQVVTVYVSSSGAVVTHTLPPDICGGSSPNGLVSAFSHITNPTTLNLIYRPTNATVAEIPWRSDWFPCSTDWLDNQTLMVRSAANFSTIAAMFRFENPTVREIPVVMPPAPILPDLPFAYDTVTQSIIPSNERTKFFYESCPDEPVIPPDPFCVGSQRNNVIYDLDLQRNVGIITDTVPELLTGEQPGGLPDVYSIGYHAWSPDDRYFWYSTINEQGTDDFRVYDTVLERSLDTGGFNRSLDLFHLPVWSPDSRYAAFWVTTVPDDDNRESGLRMLYVYDTLSQSVIPMTLSSFEIEHVNPIVWSPDTPEFVTWDDRGNLYRVDVEARTQSLIDTQITEVIAWSIIPSHLEHIAHADTKSRQQIASMNQKG